MRRWLCLAAAAAAAWTAAARADAPAPVNPYRGRCEREAVFAFAARPGVVKEGDGWVIAFAAKGRCDAAVAIVDAGGRIVRHLACGVLGANAPHPFGQDSLSQRIAWDGRADDGTPAPPGCRVRVSLGLKVSYDRTFGWDPYIVRPEATGLACDPRGQLYVMSAGPTVRVFGREGDYLRTIMPPAANVPPEAVSLIDWTTTTWGAPAVRRWRRSGGSLFDMYNVPRFSWSVPPQAPAAWPDGRLGLLTPGANYYNKMARLILMDGRNGAVPADAVVTLGALNSRCLALSPDGRWLYLGGVPRLNAQAPAQPYVSRVPAARPGPAERFAGDATPGDDNAHFKAPQYVGCDGAGNVYVSDAPNGRIQVFRPDGAYLKTIRQERLMGMAVHPKTGAIYVLWNRNPNASHRPNPALVKLGGLEDPSVKASFEAFPRTSMPMCLDATSDPPAVWVGVGSHLWRMRDLGDRFDKEFDLASRSKADEGWGRWSPAAIKRGWSGSVDRATEDLYVRAAEGAGLLRFRGRTGQFVEALPGRLGDAHPGPDGQVYVGRWGAVSRYDPSAPGKLEPVLTAGHNGSARGYPDSFAVAPNGDIYLPVGATPEQLAELEKAGLPRPARTGLTSTLLRVYAKDGRLKSPSALPGMTLSWGVHVARSGAVYLVNAFQPADQKLPDGIAPGGGDPRGMWGSLIKFNSTFGAFPVGTIRGGPWSADGLPPDAKPTHRFMGKPIVVDNALWSYGGVMPVSEHLGSCTCQGSWFDLDDFERSWVPAAQTHTINVLDANGNVVTRIGGYGNADCRGPDSPVADPKTGTLRPRRPDDPADLKSPLPELGFTFPQSVAVSDEAAYVFDEGGGGEGGGRIVRTVLGYHAQETVPLP